MPALITFVWFGRQMSRPRLEPRWVYLFTAGVTIAVFLVLAVYSQIGYLGAFTEERYFFYVVPALWLGAFAALEDGSVRASELLACGLAMAALYGAIPFLAALSQETAFLAPVEAIVPHVLTLRLDQLGLGSLTTQDALALLALCAAIALAVVWRRLPYARAWGALGAAAVVQLLIAGYAYAVIDGHVPGIYGRTSGTVAPLGWVDAHAGGQRVAWLADVSSAAPPATISPPGPNQMRQTLFWNSSVRSWVQLSQIGLSAQESPLAALPGMASLYVDTASGSLEPAAEAGALREVVEQAGSPWVQLAGSLLGRSPDEVLRLTRLTRPVRAIWLALGLTTDGYVQSGPPVRLYAFAPAAATAQEVNVEIAVAAPAAGASTSLAVSFGASHSTAALRAATRTLRLSACLPPGRRAVTGTLLAVRSASVAGRALAAGVSAVSSTVTSLARARC